MPMTTGTATVRATAAGTAAPRRSSPRATFFDGLGTILIGLLLVGESATPEHQDRIVTALEEGTDISVIHMRTMHPGPEELLVAARRPARRDRRLRGGG